MEQHKCALIGLYRTPALLQSHWFDTQLVLRGSLQEILIPQKKKDKSLSDNQALCQISEITSTGRSPTRLELARDLCPPHRAGAQVRAPTATLSPQSSSIEMVPVDYQSESCSTGAAFYGIRWGGSKCQGTGCKVNTKSVFQPAASKSSQTIEKKGNSCGSNSRRRWVLLQGAQASHHRLGQRVNVWDR